MFYLLILPFLLQGAAMIFDEFYFHRKRGLGKWERIGHPLDTISVLLCYSVILLTVFSLKAAVILAALTMFSSLLVTKDEWVHHAECPPAESWLHAVLFVLHPMVFISAGFIWSLHTGALLFTLLGLTQIESNLLWSLVQAQAALILGFFFYQIIYWQFRQSNVARRQNEK